MLEIPLNLYLDVDYKQGRFSKILPKKSFKFVSCKKNNTIVFNLSFILLSAKVNLILEEESCKRYILITCSTNCIKIVFALLTKVIIFYM